MKSVARSAALAALVLGVAAAAQAVGSLSLGASAPALNVATWVKGKPIKGFEKGKVYVVEFWATWCGPCKQSIPHLTELAKKYNGKATFTGVSVWEKNAPKGEYKTYTEKVQAFVKDWGAKMDYNVAADDEKGIMADTWMKAAEQNGIPTAFVIDKDGKIAWIGHPMGDLDRVVGEVVDGSYNLQAEMKKQADAKAASEAMMSKVKPFLTLMNAKKYPEAVEAMDKAFAEDEQLERGYGAAKFFALCQYDGAKASAYGKHLALDIYNGDPGGVNSVAWPLVDDAKPVKGADVKVAIEIGEVGMSKLKDGDPQAAFLIDTVAYAYFKDGQIDKAIALQEKALKAADATKDFDAATRKEIAGRLEMFKQKKNGGGR